MHWLVGKLCRTSLQGDFAFFCHFHKFLDYIEYGSSVLRRETVSMSHFLICFSTVLRVGDVAVFLFANRPLGNGSQAMFSVCYLLYWVSCFWDVCLETFSM